MNLNTHMKSASLIIVFSLLTFSCLNKPTADVEAQISIDSLFKNYYKFKKQINPIEATKAGFNEYNSQFANYISTPYREGLIKKYSEFLNDLTKYDSTTVSSSQWMSIRVMAWDCKIKREGLLNPMVTVASPMYDLPSFELMPLLQIQSLHLYFSQLAGGTSVQPFHSVADYDNWLKRVDQYFPFLDTCISKMKVGVDKGIVLPKVLIERMIPQLEGFIHAPITEHIFYAPIKMMPTDFSSVDRERLTKDYAEMIQSRLIPKYTELQQFLVNTYLPAGRKTAGISALPAGADTYNYLLRLHTTTTLTADQIHELGKTEVARIRGEMEKIKAEIGFKGDLKEFFNHVRTSNELLKSGGWIAEEAKLKN